MQVGTRDAWMVHEDISTDKSSTAFRPGNAAALIVTLTRARSKSTSSASGIVMWPLAIVSLTVGWLTNLTLLCSPPMRLGGSSGAVTERAVNVILSSKEKSPKRIACAAVSSN